MLLKDIVYVLARSREENHWHAEGAEFDIPWRWNVNMCCFLVAFLIFVGKLVNLGG